MTVRSRRISLAWRGTVAAVVVAGAVMVGGASVVRADDVVNDVDLTIDAAAEVMTLTAGGGNGSTQLRIVTTSGDGKNGCNLTGQTEMSAAVTSSNTTVARVSPATVTFDGCGDVQTLTVTPLGAGSSTISLSQQFNDTGATFNFAPATFTVNVAPAPSSNAAPNVDVTGVAAGSYEFGSVPVAGCAVVDAEDGDSTFPATLSAVTGALSGFGLGSQTATCAYTDEGGLNGSASVTYQIVDSGQPTIALQSRLPGPNDLGWNNGEVTVTWSCDDTVSGVTAETVTATVSAEGAGQSASGTCSDGAGNSSQATVSDISIDKTPPAIELDSVTPDGSGWQTSPVVVTWSCTDTGGSGVVSPTVTTTIDGDGSSQTATGVCTDRAGNTSTPATVGNIAVDRTPPSITLKSRTPANSNGWNSGDVTVEWTCADATSGVVSDTVTATVGGEGVDQTATGSCTDGAGNTASATEAHINIDTTAPVTTLASRTPAANDAGWNNTDVVVTWTCADDGAGPAAPKVSATVGTEGADQTATASCIDLAGNTADGSVEDINIDKTTPTITYRSRTKPNEAGWNNVPVAVTWACDDDRSGVAAATVTETLTVDGSNQSATGTCTDRAGNTASDTHSGVNIDRTGPTVELSTRTPANEHGWNNTPVTVAWTCTDALSGPERETVSTTASSEGVNQTAAAECADIAGNTSPATLDGINIDMTEPTLTSSRTEANEAGWNRGDVTVTWTCEDDRSGVASVSPEQTLHHDGAGQSVEGSCSDKAGNTTADTVEDINIDATRPTLTGDRTGANEDGWNNTEVTVAWTCADTGSGVDAVTPDQELDDDGADQAVEGSCTDKAGNTTTAVVEHINIDTAKPTLTATRTPANGDGWNNTDVIVKWTCTDALSDVKSVTPATTVDTEGTEQSVDGSCVDKAGNTTEKTVVDINLDRTNPSIEFNGGPAADASYVFGSVPAAPTCTASDQLSGPDACTVTGHATTVGSHTMTAKATDRAGNQTTVTRSYTVQPWKLSGFYQPVDMDGVWNTVKSGSTVPLKFEVFAGTTELTNPSIATFTVKGATCPGASATTADIEFTTTGGTSLRYDTTGGQFIQNWQTPKNPGGCYAVTMTTTDGSSITANFKLK